MIGVFYCRCECEASECVKRKEEQRNKKKKRRAKGLKILAAEEQKEPRSEYLLSLHYCCQKVLERAPKKNNINYDQRMNNDMNKPHMRLGNHGTP